MITTAPARIAACTAQGHPRTGSFFEVTLRESNAVHVRLNGSDGPIVRLTPGRFAGLGAIPVGLDGLHIGDTVTLTIAHNGNVTYTRTGQIESVLFDGQGGHGQRVMLLYPESTVSTSAPVGTFRNGADTITATIVKAA